MIGLETDLSNTIRGFDLKPNPKMYAYLLDNDKGSSSNGGDGGGDDECQWMGRRVATARKQKSLQSILLLFQSRLYHDDMLVEIKNYCSEMNDTYLPTYPPTNNHHGIDDHLTDQSTPYHVLFLPL